MPFMPLQLRYRDIPIFIKFLGIVLLSVSICAFFIGYIEYFVSKDKLAVELGGSLKYIAVTGALMLDGDMHQSIRSKEDRAYVRIQEDLRRIKALNELDAPIYTLKKKGKKVEYVVSTEYGTLLGGECSLRKELESVFMTGKAEYTPIYSDKNGTWISAYAPIRDKNGDIVGALEIDHHVGFIMEELRRRLYVIVLSCAAGFIFSLILTIPFLNTVTTSIRKLGEAATELEKGNYDYNIDVKSSDEIGHLAEAFRKMRLSIKKYIKELKNAQAKVVRSEKLAAIGKLSSSVGHELRGPLGVMRNSLYFIKMKSGGKIKDEKIKKHFDILEEEISNSDRIISNLLDFARVKAPTLEKVDINGTIKDIVTKLAFNRGVEVLYRLDSGLSRISADKFQISQVIRNMILNANDAMPEGGKLTLETSLKEGFVEIEIGDTGAGIPAENMDKIFEPLFSTRPKGTGLGLAVCTTIIGNHNGQIKVESKVGEGSTFVIELPAKEE